MTVRRPHRLVAVLLPVLLAATLLGISSPSIRATAAEARQRASFQLNATHVEVGRPVTAKGRFRPAVRGRTVRLQVRDGARWRTVAKDRQNRRGRVSLTVPTLRAGTFGYRLRAVPKRGLRAVSSKVRTLTVMQTTVPKDEAGRLVPLRLGGMMPNAPVEDAALSADGRYVVVVTEATNLTPGENDPYDDVFWADLAGTTVRKLSRPWASGAPVNGASRAVSMSADGQQVVYETTSSGITPNDTNAATDVVWWSAASDRNVRLSTVTSLPGRPAANAASTGPDISADGSTVVFSSEATNLVAEPNGGLQNVFVVELAGGAVNLLTRGYDGTPASGASALPAVSASGRHVAVLTNARNLLPEMANAQAYDIVWFDRQTGQRRWVTREPDDARVVKAPAISPDGSRVALDAHHGPATEGQVSDVLLWRQEDPLDRLTRISRTPTGAGGNGASKDPVFSADGRRLLFVSAASDLVPGTPVGRQLPVVADLAGGRLSLLTRPDTATVTGGAAAVWDASAGPAVLGLAQDPDGPGRLTPYLWQPCSEEYPC